MGDFIMEDELRDVKERVEKLVKDARIIGCHKQNTQIQITRTPHKQVVCQFQFPDGYPNVPVLTELKSKVFNARVLDIMTKRLDEEIKKFVGRPQIISVVKFLSLFFEETPLLVCSEEISKIKKDLVQAQDDFKLKQKSGVIVYHIVQDKYYLDVRLTIPDQYPTQCVSIEYKTSNFPTLLHRHLIAQSVEISRQCVQPPLKTNPKGPVFQPKPSLFPVIDYLVKCVRSYPREPCQVCKKKALTENPTENQTDGENDTFIEWVYCGHLYHHSCLDTFMKTPPFTGGKKCPGCGKRIYHEKWNITPTLAEERWAHKEARNREISEVADFLDLS